jgi:aryl-alcohol dehydrogenase
MKTIAGVVTAAGEPFALQEITLPDCGPREVIVALTATGMCHTDLAVRDGQLYETPFPIVLGHEGAGTVTSVGSDVTSLQPGDQVVLSFRSCQACRQCIAGNVAYCVRTLALNYGSGTGTAEPSGTLSDGSPVYTRFFGQSSFAKHAVVAEHSAVPVDAGSDLMWLGPFGCSVQAGAGAVMNVARPGPGESVVIFGLGAVGLSVAIAAKLAGCAPVIAVDRLASRLALAAELGADVCLRPDDDVVRTVRRATAGGAAYSFDCTGVPSVLPDAVRLLDRLGTCVVVGAVPPRSQSLLDSSQLLAGRTVRGTTAGDSNPRIFIPRLVRLWRAGKLPVERMASVFPLADLELAASAMKSGDVLKPIVTN